MVHCRPFDTARVWTGALRRYASKVNSLTYKVKRKTIAAEARGQDVSIDEENKLLEPLASIGHDGKITWHDKMLAHLQRAGLDHDGAES